MNNTKRTIFCDIDGTLIKHKGSQYQQILEPPELLPGVVERFCEWDKKGYQIILVTGRKESSRKITEIQLSTLGLFYDQLIMGIGNGKRILINDFKEGSTESTAQVYCLTRNKGLEGLEI